MIAMMNKAEETTKDTFPEQSSVREVEPLQAFVNKLLARPPGLTKARKWGKENATDWRVEYRHAPSITSWIAMQWARYGKALATKHEVNEAMEVAQVGDVLESIRAETKTAAIGWRHRYGFAMPNEVFDAIEQAFAGFVASLARPPQ
ncbi:hypothetical protein LCGC14_2556010 [marine sediment metagenome]|uniref:Uncharacterized protein n=1 Tax=marine sediment metagenome TaxID=412755 RepID=A0A0F9ALE6_9ZZZZ